MASASWCTVSSMSTSRFLGRGWERTPVCLMEQKVRMCSIWNVVQVSASSCSSRMPNRCARRCCQVLSHQPRAIVRNMYQVSHVYSGCVPIMPLQELYCIVDSCLQRDFPFKSSAQHGTNEGVILQSSSRLSGFGYAAWTMNASSKTYFCHLAIVSKPISNESRMWWDNSSYHSAAWRFIYR